MCRVFGISKGRYYDWRGRAARRDERDVRDQRLVRTIEVIHLNSKKKYRGPNVTDRLQTWRGP
jgi:hypothetical protein